MRCEKVHYGWKQKCNTRLEEYFGTYGNLHYRCPKCSRVERGLCWDCGQHYHKTSKSVLCEECRIRRKRQTKINYNHSPKGRRAIKRYRTSERGLESNRKKAKRKYDRDKAKIIQALGYSSHRDPSPPPQKSGWKVYKDK